MERQRTPKVATVPQVAKILQVSTRTVQRLIARHALPEVRVGGRVRVDTEALTNWIRRGGTSCRAQG